MVSRYPNAPEQYDQNQLDQLTRTITYDLNNLSQPFGTGYSAGEFSIAKILTGGGRTYAVGSVGSVSVQTNGATVINVDSGSDASLNNLAEVIAGLIIDMKARGLLG